MPTPTYVAIAKTVLTGSQADVTFSSIPSTYTDLLLTVSSRGDRAVASETISIQFNGDTATNYSLTDIASYGSTVSSSRTTSAVKIYNLYTVGANGTSNTFGSFEVYIPNYTASTNKPVSVSLADIYNDTATMINSGLAGLWRNSSAINSIKLFPFSGNFVSGSRFDLYGIKNS
jgi:hypothetical protein